MSSNGFLRCQANQCCYIKSFDGSYIILLLYDDDMLIVGASMQVIDTLKKQLSGEFVMKDLGAAKQILGMRITRDKKVLKLSQEKYVKKVLSRFNMDRAKPVSILLASYFHLSKNQAPSSKEEHAYMVKVLLPR